VKRLLLLLLLLLLLVMLLKVMVNGVVRVMHQVWWAGANVHVHQATAATLDGAK